MDQQIVVAKDLATTDFDPDTGFPLATGAQFGNPDIAVDPGSGKLYVAWEDSRFSAGNHNDIAMSASADDGETWSTPVKVNQTPVPVMAFAPSVDVLPNGTIGVTYYDIRHNTPAQGLLTDYHIATSRDGGACWTETP
jgi:Neuraminidase (sialidase)